MGAGSAAAPEPLGSWAAVRLRQGGSNRDAIGATVHYEAGALHGSRVVRSGSSFLSQSELPLTLGIGRLSTVDRLTVNWPSGGKAEYRGLKAGASYEIIEGRGMISVEVLKKGR